MGALSVIAEIITMLLLYCSIFITLLKGFKVGRKYLFIALIPLFVCIACKIEDIEIALRVIFGVAMLCPLFGSFSILRKQKEDRVFGFVNLIVLVLCVMMLFSKGISFSGGSSGDEKKCVLCEKNAQAHGEYCSSCYDEINPD